MTLPTDADDRKQRPITTGCLDYFPDALAEVAHASWVGNEQHHKGSPLHWDKSKSTDEADSLVRHLIQRGTYDSDGVRHTAKVAWRALALLQREIEATAYPGVEKVKRNLADRLVLHDSKPATPCCELAVYHTHQTDAAYASHPAAVSFKEQWNALPPLPCLVSGSGPDFESCLYDEGHMGPHHFG